MNINHENFVKSHETSEYTAHYALYDTDKGTFHLRYHNMGFSEKLDGTMGWNEWVEIVDRHHEEKENLFVDKKRFQLALKERQQSTADGEKINHEDIVFVKVYIKSIKRIEAIKCESCGSNNAHLTTCPYSEEVYGENVDATLCDDCYQERIWDI